MFTLYRIGCEPEIYIEDYQFIVNQNNEYLAINDYKNEEGYHMIEYPVLSVDRKHETVELYNFHYDCSFDDNVNLIKAIEHIVDLKNELNINNYVVVGDGANIYYQLYKTQFIK